MRKIGVAFALFVLGMTLCPAIWAGSDEFHWTGVVNPGQEVEIKGVNGNIEATSTGGGQVEVTAVKRGRKQDPSSVDIQVVPHAGGVTICAVYPDADGRNTCEPGKGGRMNVRDNDVTVEFTVRVPAGVNFVGKTVNGNVDARSIEADAAAFTVNGNADVSCEGLAKAKTVNGSISVLMGASRWNDDLEFETVNGSIRVEIPSNASAEVSAETVNGGIDTDFSIPVTGRWGPKKMHGSIGSGGARLELKTVNGGIELRSGR